MKSIVQKLTAMTMLTGGSVLAEGHHEGLSMDAPVLWEIPIPFWEGHSIPVNNSLVMFTLAVLLFVFKDNLRPVLEQLLYSKEELEILHKAGF